MMVAVQVDMMGLVEVNTDWSKRLKKTNHDRQLMSKGIL